MLLGMKIFKFVKCWNCFKNSRYTHVNFASIMKTDTNLISHKCIKLNLMLNYWYIIDITNNVTISVINTVTILLIAQWILFLNCVNLLSSENKSCISVTKYSVLLSNIGRECIQALSVGDKFAKNIYTLYTAIKEISILRSLQCVLWKNVHTVSVFQRKRKLKSLHFSYL